MKTLLALFIALTLASPAAFAGSNDAEGGYLACSNGTIDQMGDALFQVNILEDGMEFLPYEGSFSVEATDFVNTLQSYAIVDKEVKMSSEGEESTTIVNAMLLLNEENTKLSVAISYDRGPFQTYEMSCERK